MNHRRFEIRPIASRRLRAALLLVFALSLVGVSQTRLSGAELIVALLAMIAILADAVRRTRMPACTLLFENRPLSCRLIDPAGVEIPLDCLQANAYPWLVVLKFDAIERSAGFDRTWLKRPLVLLPDSLPGVSRQNWRRLLVWSYLSRRQIASR